LPAILQRVVENGLVALRSRPGNNSHHEQRCKDAPAESARARSRRFHYNYIMPGKFVLREGGICPLF
jgi:hypothetical protein